MREALDLIRRDLGPDASVLHTREVSGNLLGWMVGSRQLEVTASSDVNVPSRFPQPATPPPPTTTQVALQTTSIPPAHSLNYRAEFQKNLKRFSSERSLMDDLCISDERATGHELSELLFQLFTDLIDAEISEDLARGLIDRVRDSASVDELDDPLLLKARMMRMVECEINVCGPIRLTPGRARIAALIGPTGVGKTTTIAKLAANFRLRERCRVGLITVDTYRIAAVEQLRTYADIMDLPMEVVSTPREMRKAIEQLSDLDLVLLDTAGRSPRDELKIQELKSMLAEARPDEVHLVLSVVTNTSVLQKTAEQFADLGSTALILTKLDEASGLGNLLPLLRRCKLPLSYLTNGQNVPDDICHADRRELTRSVLGME